MYDLNYFYTFWTKQLGGPGWSVKLGRRDSKRASLSAANSGVIPPPSSTLNNLINRFRAQGLSTRDMVALSGAHTIGQARCVTFRNRIYNSSNIELSFAASRRRRCPAATGSGDNNVATLDLRSPGRFDLSYYRLLLNQRGLLTSDQVLFNNGSTDSLVVAYSRSLNAFYRDFARAMVKMGDINPLTGSKGQIRTNCRRPNWIFHYMKPVGPNGPYIPPHVFYFFVLCASKLVLGQLFKYTYLHYKNL